MRTGCRPTGRWPEARTPNRAELAWRKVRDGCALRGFSALNAEPGQDERGQEDGWLAASCGEPNVGHSEQHCFGAVAIAMTPDGGMLITVAMLVLFHSWNSNGLSDVMYGT